MIDSSYANAENIAAYLRRIKERAGISSQEWSVRSGVSEATISRLLSGQNQSPQFYNVAQLVKSVGGSLDELANIPRAPSAPPSDKALAHMIAMDKQREETVFYLQNQVTELQANAKHQHRLLIICTAVLGLFLFLFGALLAWDLSDPRYGFLYRVISAMPHGSRLPFLCG